MNQQGMTLVEIVVAVALFGIVVTAIIMGLAVGILVVSKVDDSSVASQLARSQMEFVLSQPYAEPVGYEPVSPIPDGFGVSITGTTLLPGRLQEVVVQVSAGGESLLELSGYKANPGD